jgi:hypothetical protein
MASMLAADAAAKRQARNQTALEADENYVPPTPKSDDEASTDMFVAKRRAIRPLATRLSIAAGVPTKPSKALRSPSIADLYNN